MLALAAAGDAAAPASRFGVLPAFRASRRATPARCATGAHGPDGARHRTRARDAGGRGAIAASVVLLVASGLLVRALWRVQQIDPGFRAENVLTLRTALPGREYGETASPAAVLRPRRSAKCGRCRASQRGLHQLPADGDARRDLAGDSRLRKRLSEALRSWAPDPSETRMASFRLVDARVLRRAGHPAAARAATSAIRTARRRRGSRS